MSVEAADATLWWLICLWWWTDGLLLEWEEDIIAEDEGETAVGELVIEIVGTITDWLAKPKLTCI